MKPNTPYPAYCPPLRAEGRSVKYVDHGSWHTVASTNTRGVFIREAEEQNAVWLAHAANLHHELVDTLRLLTDGLGDGSERKLASVEAIANARALLAKCEKPQL